MGRMGRRKPKTSIAKKRGKFVAGIAASLPRWIRKTGGICICQHCGRYVQTGEKPEPQPDPENLDDMPLEDLQAYCHNADKPAPLREYAAIKARAMQARLGGRIQQALQWEKALDGLYSLLPETFQW